MSSTPKDPTPTMVRAAGDLCVGALYTDGAHHKQWYLEQILKVLGFDLDVIRAEQVAADYGEWEEGIVP